MIQSDMTDGLRVEHLLRSVRRLSVSALALAAVPFAGMPLALLSVDVAFAQGAAQRANETVRVRVGEHEGYTRLLFAWPSSATYLLRRDGDRVSIEFARPAQADDSQLRRVRPARIDDFRVGAGQDGLLVRFDVPNQSRLREFRVGSNLVFDIVDGAADDAANAGRPGEALAPVPGPVARVAAASALQVGQASAADDPVRSSDQGPATAPVQVAQAAPAPPAIAPPTPVPPTPALPTQAGAAPVSPPPAVPAPVSAPASVIPATPVAAPSNSVAPAPAVLPASPAPSPQPAGPREATVATPVTPPQAPLPAPAPGIPAVTPVNQQAAGFTVTLGVSEPAAAAVFVRAGFLYVFFDRQLSNPLNVQFSDDRARVQIESGPIEDGTALRMRMPAGMQPSVEGGGRNWVIRFSPGGGVRTFGLPVRTEPVSADLDFALGARLLIQAQGATRILRFGDLEIGDQLRIIPLATAPQGIASQTRSADVEVLPSLHGIVVRPLRDDLTVRLVANAVEVSAPGGLSLSPQRDVLTAPRLATIDQRLIDIATWRREGSGSFLDVRRQLLDSVSDDLPGAASPRTATRTQREADRQRDRLELARFYLAHGFAQEALASIARIHTRLDGGTEDRGDRREDLEHRPEVLAVRGAANIWAGRPDAGRQDLSDSLFDDDLDVLLWRAVAEAQLGRWTSAHNGFVRSRAALSAYPNTFFQRFALLAAEAAIEQGELEEARELLNQVDSRVRDRNGNAVPASSYLRGLAEYKSPVRSRFETAEVGVYRPDVRAQWVLASSQGQDRLTSVRADFGLVQLDLDALIAQEANGFLPREVRRSILDKLVEKTERLTFAWRGDDLEVRIRRKLAELHFRNDEYSRAFTTLREVIELFPDDPARPEIEAWMTNTFVSVFAKDGAARLDPVDALLFYDEWRSLTPTGRQGDIVLNRLVDRLVEADLLDRAADLLEQQVRDRLTGPEKAAVGARLAAIRLLDNRPTDAVQAITESEVPSLSPDLVRERRLLYARSLAELGRTEQALRLLDGDTSELADRLRVDIAWRAQRWREADAALALLVGPAPQLGVQLDDQKQSLLLNRAVAVALSGDAAGLAQLRDQYSLAVEGTPIFETFRLLTRPEQATGLLDIQTIQRRVGEVDMFRAFLDEYRSRATAGG